MDFFADILLGFGALFAAVYCLILSRKLSKLKGLDQDLGSAIAILSKQVDEMTKVLTEAKETATESSRELEDKTSSAKEIADRLEMMIAALHDLPDPSSGDAASAPEEESDKTVTMFMRNASRKQAS
ncbi:hypothetical protein C8N43_2232 [Litoreibacter ponti]|uniref:DUF6468 domain-containing protein n=1 Tax=Litoreibacter ponti TaxID=1510457 RepID=A0A2T6BND5_9RHOB|nr:DUF6468 domain-containing protein [Litoreibacter ponti]PTX57562.1 hypothetical protein C8N43_2232 [Litoreibacter ponti]